MKSSLFHKFFFTVNNPFFYGKLLNTFEYFYFPIAIVSFFKKSF
ncbi:hypothetical protein LEP1GSC173_0429 [Leptospira interrogans str. HAI1594]|nr:hypothetical protein LEP1GSC117_2163 [Leptospira interrogans serovar Icterohaemorrhagiae str. Verdun LP]EKP77977.1 hypothetical protein LEP1GSC173_0429 [Leptospira interrogans str. HAI1594]EMO18909.1 hypothetical protein LEP1GSC167_3241 [Leptospira interrogans serovar Copenhageni str. HAI0188]EMO37089.1 hypothetical protein LEP1GSC177_1631 [Leptospira interrogans str. MMD3731]EMY52659.1 hypothetical protein LEP1GSC204_2415 [Leptospira interrogans serovar Copenhageni str. M20]